MSLTTDIQKAFETSTLSEEDKGQISQLAEDLATAIVKWVTAQTFTITEMKASLEVENFRTTAPLMGDVLPSVTIVNGFGPGTVVSGLKGAMTPVNLKKGLMIATGHAHIGNTRKAHGIPGGDTSVEWNNFTKVKLDPNKVVDK